LYHSGSWSANGTDAPLQLSGPLQRLVLTPAASVVLFFVVSSCRIMPGSGLARDVVRQEML
jgi:hypothetical protein